MAPLIRRSNIRSKNKMKIHRRKPNIPALVYKYLRNANEEVQESALHSSVTKCQFCKQRKRHGETSDSLNSQRTGSRNMANGQRKGTYGNSNSKVHAVKRRRAAKEKLLSSCMHKPNGLEGLRKVKRYIQKALDFGVEWGYLTPNDSTFQVLRVSSDLMTAADGKGKVRMRGRTVSVERDRSPRRSPTKFEDDQEPDLRARKRRRGRRRSRSASKKRRRRSSRRRRRTRSRSANPEEAIENVDDGELPNDERKRGVRDEKGDEDAENAQSDPPDEEKTTTHRDEDGSDLSVDEDESDEEEETKRDKPDKS